MFRRILQYWTFSFVFLSSLFCFSVFAAPSAPVELQVKLDVPTRRQAIKNVVHEMKANYVFPEIAEKAGSILMRNLEEKKYDAPELQDAVKFAEQLTKDIMLIAKDKHIRVRVSEKPLPLRLHYEPTPQEIAEYRHQSELDNFGVEKVEHLPCNIGYIDLRSFDDVEFAAESIAAAMNLIAHADALIVDLRNNHGGDPATVAFMESYLFEEPIHLNSIYWRRGDITQQLWTQSFLPGKRFGQQKPVYVLTAPDTFSGAEDFSYTLQSHKRAKIVGETTRGGANPGDRHQISERLTIFIPNGRSISPVTKGNWEGVGVIPDIKVPAENALHTAQMLILESLLKIQKDPKQIKLLNERVHTLKSLIP